jgi:hypothetical protein
MSDYAEQQPLVRYLREYQYPQRKQIVRAWTSYARHFGNITTSRLEGGHGMLKMFLHNSTGDLLTVSSRPSASCYQLTDIR